MSTWFVDTSFFIALLNDDDNLHDAALELNGRLKGLFVTSTWILLELLDGCSNHANRQQAIELVRVLRDQEDLTIIPAAEERFRQGFELYEQRPDKEWSLTDCISFLIMEEYEISEALTADHHFEQAGFTALLKD